MGSPGSVLRASSAGSGGRISVCVCDPCHSSTGRHYCEICCSSQRSDGHHMLAAHQLRKNYGSLLAINDVNFTLDAGEILGYIGPNGAGKSTTVKIIAGLIEPSAGEVLFNGVPIHRDLVEYK